MLKSLEVFKPIIEATCVKNHRVPKHRNIAEKVKEMARASSPSLGILTALLRKASALLLKF